MKEKYNFRKNLDASKMEAKSVTPTSPAIESEKERKAQELLLKENVFYVHNVLIV